MSATANRTLSIQGATSRGKRVAATSEDATDPGDANAAAIPPVAIGEVITYEIDFGLADGVTAAASLRDVLQAGLTFIPGSATLARNRDGITLAADPGGINGQAAGTPVPVTPVVTGTDITLDLGDVTVTPDAVAAVIRFSFRAVVANVGRQQRRREPDPIPAPSSSRRSTAPRSGSRPTRSASASPSPCRGSRSRSTRRRHRAETW